MTDRTVLVDGTYLTDGGTLKQDNWEHPVYWGPTARAGSYFRRQQTGTNGKDRENPFSLAVEDRYEPLGSWRSWDIVTYWNSITTYPPYQNAYTVDLLGAVSCLTQADRVKVAASVLDKVRETDWNALVSLGESRETARLIADVARAISRIARKSRTAAVHELRSRVKKIRPGVGAEQESTAQLLKRAARAFPTILREKWLEARYGVIPLLSDAKAILDHFSERKALGNVTRFRSRVQRVEPRVLNGWPSITLSRLQILCLVKEAPSEIARLGLDDPASVLWELMPLSFVYDWILPIGDYLAATHMARSFSATYVTSEKNLSYLECQNHASGYYSFNGDAPLRLLRLRFTRSVSDGLDVPLPLGFKDPRESTAAFLHLADATALIGQSLSPRLTGAERRRFMSGR